MNVTGIHAIPETEVKAAQVEGNLPDRPSQTGLYGARILTAQEVKQAYDALPKLIVAYYNALVQSIAGVSGGELDDDSLAAKILTNIREGHSLKDLFEDLTSGDFSEYLKLDYEKTLADFYEDVLAHKTQIGSSPPTADTPGELGAIYVFRGEDTMQIFVCTQKTDGGTEWAQGYSDASEAFSGLMSATDKSRVDTLWKDRDLEISSEYTVILRKDAWENLQQKAGIVGLKAENTVLVSPDPKDYEKYLSAEIVAYEQMENGLLFTCRQVPDEDITVNVVSMETIKMPVLEPLFVSENGTYTPPEGISGFSSVRVDIKNGTGDIPGEISGYYPSNDAVWEIGEIDEELKTCTLTRYNGTEALADGVLRIPNEIRGYRVKKIQSYLASYHYDLETHTMTRNLSSLLTYPDAVSSVTKLIVSKGIEIIGISAFYNLVNLYEVVLPDGLLEIGHAAFAQSPFKVINFPRTLKKIDSWSLLQSSYHASLNWANLKDSAVEEIGYGATQGINNGATNYMELELPYGLKVLENIAFNHCSAFRNKELVFPATIERIGGQYNDPERTGCSHLFYNFAVNTLERYVIPTSNAQYTTDQYGAIYTKDHKTLVAVPPKYPSATFTMHDSCEIAGECCFSRNSTIKTLKIGKSYKMSSEVPPEWLNGGNTLSIPIYNYVTALTSITVDILNPYIMSENNVVYNKEGTVAWYTSPRGTADIVIRDGCKTIERGFLGSDDIGVGQIKVPSITIPASVSKIETHTLATLNKIMSRTVLDEANPHYEKDPTYGIMEKHYPLTIQASGVACHNYPSSVTTQGEFTMIVVNHQGYKLPDSVTVSGADYEWNKSEGTLHVYNITGAVTVTITGVKG